MRGWSRVDLQTSAFCFAKSPQFLAVSLIGIKSRCVWIERTYIDMLLRDDLVESDKIAIAMVVIRTRQHLAAVKPQKKGLMLELMHISTEENSPNMPEYRGLFDEAISQRDR
jgi:hypothetical protein